jgi:hypothetical protein
MSRHELDSESSRIHIGPLDGSVDHGQKKEHTIIHEDDEVQAT